ncbi:MAG: 3D-(3,5/4)-trihydroxycyclohexane-1,2-dione acylhydrolase (decyclizing) [Fastidiosipilaceae bacterium]|jgi:3D-(3,5/4)-trihydroxycyclohexane-1,2-dione acylhydrolase (decyclizing)|nr:3D-(3,5/4)-trihydroxycyclohexane-1,2-dione acylhydrolase (decyclizing) [Clostridiaceae bacterium]
MTKTIRLTMAQALLKFLDNQYFESDGVENKFVNGMFGIFGHGCVTGVGEALEYEDHNLTFYQGKNEQSMALAAVGFAKQKKRKEIIPCLSSVGPGAINMVTACGCATANRIPLLVLPGDTFATRQPDPVLQQAEIFSSVGTTVNDAFRAVTHYFDRINRPEQLMTAAINAMRVLTDPVDTGAVCLALPQDVESEAYDYPEYFFRKRVWHNDRRYLTQAQVDRAVEVIKASKKPFMVLGGGVVYSEAGEAFKAFAERHNIPFGETQAGKGTVAWDHEYNLGGVGVTGTKAANLIARDADLIFGVGTRFSDFTTSSKWLYQNPDVRFLTLNVAPFDAFKMDAEGILGDARCGLEQISETLGDWKADYGDEIAERKAEWNAIVDSFYEEEHADGLSQRRAVAEINKFMTDDDIVVCAAGSLPGDLQRMWRPGKPGTYHVEYGFSNMGYDLNGALGVKLAAEENQDVYAMVGDGGYIMLNAEIHTMVQEQAKVNIMVLDNQGWGCIEDLQNEHGGNSYGTVFLSRNKPGDQALLGERMMVDFAKNGESLGCKGYTCTTVEELRVALQDSRDNQTGPCVFDVKVVPKTMTQGYNSWWRVGVAEVSKSPEVREARKVLDKYVSEARVY